MTLAEQLEDKFRGDIRFRGAAYVEAERVSIARVTPDEIFAVVRDGVEHQTQLTREKDQLRMYCTCAKGSLPDPACKHLWATILAVDEGGYLTGSPRPGYVPPFAVEPDSAGFDDDWDEVPVNDVYLPSTADRAQRARLQFQPRLREWESRLLELRQSMDASAAAGGKAGREREIVYEIDVDESRESRQLVIQTSQRQRRASGQWGKLKPLKLRSGQLDAIEHDDDRRILAFLSGATPQRTNWYAQQAETQTSVHRYHLPHELCELLLPFMCATNRVRLLGTDEQHAQPLTWDDGPAWQLCLALVPQHPGDLEPEPNEMRVATKKKARSAARSPVTEQEESGWQLQGRLRRGEECLPFDRTRLIVPGGLVVTETSIGRLEDFGAYDWVALIGKGPLNVPDGEEEEFVDRLLDMPTVPRLELPASLQLEEVRSTPQPLLLIHSPRGVRWHQERLRGEVHFNYLGAQVRGSDPQAAIVQRDQGRCLLRNRSDEERAWADAQNAGFRRLLDHRRAGADVEIPARELGPAVRTLVGNGWQVHADGKQVRQPGELKFRVQSGIDWFELHADVDFEGRRVAFPELLSALSRGDSTVRLDDGSIGILPDEWLRQYGLLAGLGIAEEGHVRFANNQAGLLDALLASQPYVDLDERFRELRDRLQSFSGVVEADEPDGFIGHLREYQKQGLGWLMFLREFGFGGCLADDMGLGKTVQLLALLQNHSNGKSRVQGPESKVKGRGRRPSVALDSEHSTLDSSPSLIVVPKSLLFNWQQECERFTPGLKILEYTGLDRAPLRKKFPRYDIVLTTYGTLRRDILELKECPFEYVVLDEAQSIKNSTSQVAKAARLLRANHRLALSGTPIENHLGDLWSIFEFLNPGMLGRSSMFKIYAANAEDHESRDLLARGLRPFILRRTKRQVASELPEKFEQTIHCKMGQAQTRLYNELRDHYRDSLLGMVKSQGMGKSKMHVLEALLRLRQAACHPALLDRESDDEMFAKISALCPQLEELLEEGHKALVFSQFTSMLAIVRKHLDKRGIVYEYLDGQTRNRREHVERFQSDPDCGLFLISLKAGGLGLNLTAADYVFLLDPWWNPAVETQAIDRAHRVGQSRQVFAYRLICQGTVEEKIAELQEKKKSLANAILQENSNVLKDLSTDDLEMLLS